MSEQECTEMSTLALYELARGIAASKTLWTLHLHFHVEEKDKSLFVDAFE